MRTMGVGDAQSQFLRLLDKGAKGQRVTITQHGTPLARLVLTGITQQRDVRAVIGELLEFQKGNTLGDITIRGLIVEGRRAL
jgi:antitoxin (DNA-binding transcriptional repressor) of toxin-antitoxin stability system